MSRQTTLSPESNSELLIRGRKEGYATAALALSAVSFTHLLGAEKALLAIVLAVLALRGGRSSVARTRGWAAIALAGIYIVTVATVLVLFHDKLAQLIELLKDLG
jgi:hypothetical protein